MRPATLVVIARRAALRRKYGYAALRVLHRGVKRAMEQHMSRTLDADRPYDGEGEPERIFSKYRDGLKKLQKRWPNLDLTDPRAAP